eukprot:GILK01005530.1.p1 GENE.GILK01005530.1~~GILK01005530.1.p1  ORF type:complete len:1061 (-),score=364.83 GILK01005530.1:145-3327(-)
MSTAMEDQENVANFPELAAKLSPARRSPLREMSRSEFDKENNKPMSNKDTLLAELEALKEEKREFTADYEKLMDEGKKLYETYTKKCNKLKEIGGEYEQLKVLYEDKELECLSYISQIEQLQAHVQAAENSDNTVNEEEMMALREQLREAQMDQEQLRCQLQSVQQESVEKRETELQQTRKERDDAIKMAEKYRIDLQQVQEINEKLEKEHMDMEELMQSSKKQFEMLAFSGSERRDTLDGRLETLTISNELLREERERLERQLNQIKQTSKEWEQKCNSYESRISEFSASMAEKESELLKCKQEVSSAKSRAADQLESMESRFNQERSDLQRQISELEVKLTDHEEIKSSLNQERQKDLDAQMEKLKLTHARTESELRGQIDTLKTINKNLENDLRMMYKKHKTQLKELEDTYQHENYKSKYTVAVHELSMLSGQLKSFVAIQEEVQQVEELTQALASQLIQNSELIQHESSVNQMDELAAQIVSLQESMNAISVERDMLKSQRDLISAERDGLEEDFRTSQTLFVQQTEHVHELESRIASLEVEIVLSDIVNQVVNSFVEPVQQREAGAVAVDEEEEEAFDGKQFLADFGGEPTSDSVLEAHSNDLLGGVETDPNGLESDAINEHGATEMGGDVVGGLSVASSDSVLSDQAVLMDRYKMDIERLSKEKEEICLFVEDERIVRNDYIAELEAEIVTLKESLASFASTQEELTQLNQVKRELEQKVNDLMQLLRTSEEESIQLRTMRDQVTDEANSNRFEMIQLKDELSSMRSDLSSVVQEYEASRVTVESITEQLRCKEMANEELNQQLQDSQIKTVQLTAQVSALQEEIRCITVKYNAVQQELEHVKKVAVESTQNQVRPEELDQLRLFLDNVRCQKESLEKELKMLRPQCSGMKTALQNQSEEITKLTNELASKQNAENLLADEVQKIKDIVVGLEQDKVELTRQLDELVALCDTQGGSNQSRDDILRLEQEMNDCKAENDRLKQYLILYKDKSDQKAKILQSNLEKAEREVESLDQVLSHAKSLLRKYKPHLIHFSDLLALIDVDSATSGIGSYAA